MIEYIMCQKWTCSGFNELTYWGPDKMAAILPTFSKHFSWFFIQISVILFPKGPINSSPPSATYMHQWTVSPFIQIMDWLVAYSAPSHYLNQCWNIVNWTIRNKLKWNLNRNSNIFIQEKVFECVVWEMAAILSRPQWVKNICQYWFR